MSDMHSNALGELIDTTKDANDWSDQDIANRAEAGGHELSKQTVSVIRTQGITTLVPNRLRALAEGLGLPLHRVVRAALATIGLEVPGDNPISPEDAIRADETLDVNTKRVVLVMLTEARSAPQLRVARRRGK